MTKIQTFVFSNRNLDSSFLSFFLSFIQASTKILSSVSSHLRIQRIMKRLLLLLATFTFIFFFFLVKRRVDRWGASNFNFHPRSLKKKRVDREKRRKKKKKEWLVDEHYCTHSIVRIRRSSEGRCKVRNANHPTGRAMIFYSAASKPL